MKFGGRPRLRVDPVRDAGDWYFLDWDPCPDILPQPSADLTVEFADAVSMTADPQCENGHAESIRSLRCRFSEPEEIVKADPEIVRVPREMADHHFARESVVSGRHRSVRCENVGRG